MCPAPSSRPSPRTHGDIVSSRSSPRRTCQNGVEYALDASLRLTHELRRLCHRSGKSPLGDLAEVRSRREAASAFRARIAGAKRVAATVGDPAEMANWLARSFSQSLSGDFRLDCRVF